MNGIVELKLPSGDKVLRFGFHGCMEFEKLCFKNPSENQAKVLTDLAYAGLVGEAMRMMKAMPTYEDAFDLVEEISAMDDHQSVFDLISETYYASKWGQDFNKRIAEFNKKKEQEESQSQ